MKTRMTLAVLLGLGLVSAVPVGAAVLIEVNVNNAAAVTFTSTGNASQVNDTSSTLYDGVDLVQFFTSVPQFFASPSFSGNLAPPNSVSAAFDRKEADAYPTVRTALALYNGGPDRDLTQVFSTAAPAFSGVGVTDFTADAASLPAAGASGDIIAGYSAGGSNAVIGQWVAVVPEPSMLVLGGIGAAAVLLRRQNAIA